MSNFVTDIYANWEGLNKSGISWILTDPTILDFLNLEKESLSVKKSELERRSTELSSLCNELRNKLKSTVASRDQTAQSATLIETKLHQAEMRIKELDTIIENIKHQSDQKCEKLNSKIEILHSRVAEADNYKRNADQLCQNAQAHSQEVSFFHLLLL